MNVVFMQRNGGEAIEVARVDDAYHFTGNAEVIAMVKRECYKRDILTADDLQKLPIVFNGSYFWAAIEK